MDHPCHKCGHSIEDGKPFCSQCGAPQIRVTVAEVPTVPLTAGTGSVPILPMEAEPSALDVPVLRGSGANTLQACGLAAAVSFGLTLLGLHFLVAALGSGFLAVTFARRRSPGTSIRPGAGARLGALSGLWFFGTLTVLNTLAVAILHKGAEIRSEQLENLQRWAARYPSPAAQPVLDFAKTPDGFAIMMVASLVMGFVVVLVLSGCGGALAATLWRRRDRT
jgi:hypothetical protein